MSDWPLCVARSVDGGAGVARPAPWPPMRMDAINTGSGQRGKEKADDFFDYAADFPVAVVCILQVGLKTILYILSPHLKSVIRGILTPEGSLALWSVCSNYWGVGTPSYYS